MIFLCDENVHRGTVGRLRADGHNVFYIPEFAPSISDEDVLERANALGAVLVTGDKDFGELMYRQGKLAAGVLLIRLHGLSPEERAELVSASVREHGGELVGAFSVLTPSKLRIRKSGV